MAFDLTDIAENGLGAEDPFLLRLEEASRPSDYTGTYLDATLVAGFTEPALLRETPPLERTLSGVGRVFVAGTQLSFAPVDVADQAGTTGSVGLAVVLELDWDAQFAYGAPATIVQHGLTTASPWGLQLELVDPSNRLAIVRLVWTSGGVAVVVAGAEFLVPVGPFVLVASRELTTAGYVVRYAAAGATLGQALVVSGTPDLTASATILVGANELGAQHLHGVLDMLHVVHRPISAEEAELLDYRLREAGPEAYVARRALAGGVKAWGTDLHLVVQREFQVEAAVLALAKTNARRIARYLRPDRAWGAALRYWEQLIAIPTRPGDGLDERRARVVTEMLGRLGCAELDLEALLAEALGYTADPTAADFAAGANEWADAMDPLVTSGGVWVSGHAQHAWLPYPNTHFTFTQPVGANDYLQGDQAGVDDLRYQGWLGQGGAAETNPPMYLHFIGSGAGRESNALGPAAIGGGKEMWARCELRAAPSFPAGLLVGLVVGSLVDDEWLWVGIRNNAGANDLVAVKYMGTVLDAAFTTLVAGVGALPRVIEVRHLGDGLHDLGAFKIKQAANVAGLTGATEYDVTGGPTRPDWGGPAASSPSTVANVIGPTSVRWADWWQRAPHAGAPQHVRVFRDPADPGIYDLPAADGIVQKYLLAQLDGTVIDAENGLSLQVATTLLDRDPLEH